MKNITRKGEIQAITNKCVKEYESLGIEACLLIIREELLKCKVKFPLLEYAAKEIQSQIPVKDCMESIPIIRNWNTIGGNVLIGIFLRNSLEKDLEMSINETVKITQTADIWYICDIIGERVYGTALLKYFEQTIESYRKLAHHPSPWVIRSLGAGAHHAIKKGLPARRVEQVFQFLLSLANHKHKEVRQGIGWAAKTTAKFHPAIIEQYQKQIENAEAVDGWFRRKVEIGLARNKYAQRNTG